MLVLTRKINESLVIGENIELTIIDISNGSVRLGFSAPRCIKIYRKELIEQITQGNREASVNAATINLDELIKKISH